MNEGVRSPPGGFWRDAGGDDAVERYRSLLDSVDDAVFELDTTGRFTGVNGGLLTATDYDRDALLGEHVSLLSAADEGAELERALERLRSNPDADVAPLDLAVETATGERLRWEVQLSPVTEGGELVSTAAIARQASSGERERRSQRHRRVMQALEASREGVSLLDEDGTFIYVNDAYAETFGYTPEAMIGEHWKELGIEANPEQFSEEVLPHIAEEGQWSGTTTCVRSDGSTFSAQHSLTHTDDDELICVVQDVSDERQRQRELERQERIIETLGDGVYAIDEDARFVMVNDAFCEMVGWEREELLGQPSTVVYDDEIESSAAEQSAAVAAGEQDEAVLEFMLVRQDGERLPVEARFRPFPGDDGDGRCGVVRDISDRRERERELRRSERRYRALVENVPNGAVGLVDEEMHYVTVGGTPLTVDDRSREELEGSHVREALSSEMAELIVPLYQDALEGKANTIEYAYDSGNRHARFRTFPVWDDDGEVFAAMGMSQDITEQVDYQRKLEESNERLEQFAYAASHDLQEPLRMVSSYLTLIEDRYEDQLDKDGQEFLEFAVDGADRMRQMIHGLLDYSRVETRGDPFEPVDLEAVFADVRTDLEVCIEESGAELTVESLPEVTGDRGQLYQLVQNLLSNAIEYSGDAPPRIHVSAEPRGDEWAITVADEGLGMDPEQADRAFELFQRLHPQRNDGTGIGLALCKRIVERHEGDIHVESEPGDGATFIVTLPARGEEDV